MKKVHALTYRTMKEKRHMILLWMQDIKLLQEIILQNRRLLYLTLINSNIIDKKHETTSVMYCIISASEIKNEETI